MELSAWQEQSEPRQVEKSGAAIGGSGDAET